MPIYEYECTKCQDKFEQFKPIYASGEDEACPKCGADAKRMVSKPASSCGCGCAEPSRTEPRRTMSFG
jgi:putative FmdB family regulatory protein